MSYEKESRSLEFIFKGNGIENVVWRKRIAKGKRSQEIIARKKDREREKERKSAKVINGKTDRELE